jgi:hypothetical protein
VNHVCRIEAQSKAQILIACHYGLLRYVGTGKNLGRRVHHLKRHYHLLRDVLLIGYNIRVVIDLDEKGAIETVCLTVY